MRYACLKLIDKNCPVLENGIGDCFVAFIEENLEGILRSVLNETCTLISLDYDWKVWESWPKYKMEFMLGDFSLGSFACIQKTIEHVILFPFAYRDMKEHLVCFICII